MVGPGLRRAATLLPASVRSPRRPGDDCGRFDQLVVLGAACGWHLGEVTKAGELPAEEQTARSAVRATFSVERAVAGPNASHYLGETEKCQGRTSFPVAVL